MPHPHTRTAPARPLAAALALFAAAVAAGPARAQLEAEEIELKAAIESWRPETFDRLREWSGYNTGSLNLEGLERFATRLPEELVPLGFRVETREGAMIELPEHGSVRVGPLVVARRPARAPGGPRFLLVGHYDTVFEPDHPFREFRMDPGDPGRARGPGVVDMKSGLLVMLTALRALGESGDLDRAEWTVLLNGDEEIGSLGSRTDIELEARRADYGFVFESAAPGGAMVRSRRGLGQVHLAVTGVAAHAGSAHRDGRSAVRELAAKIVAIEELTDYDRGVTVNVGTVKGGVKRNVVPAHAVAWVDLRYDDPALGEEVFGEIHRVAGDIRVEGTTTRVWGTLHRPPKPETPEVRALIERHAAVARDLGLRLPDPVHSGGGTDGSLMGAVGLPVLDSMGAVGGGAHTDREYVELDSLSERAALAAILLRRLARRSEPAVE